MSISFEQDLNCPRVRLFYFLLPASCVLLFLAACAPQPLVVTREPVTLRLIAADSCGPLAEELAGAYEGSHPWVTIRIAVFDSAVAQEMLQAGGADMALLSWLQETASEDEGALWSSSFARDGIAVIVHPAALLTEIGLAHLQDIFRGRVQEWGGEVLTVVSREEGSGTRAAFESIVLGDYDVTLAAVAMPSTGTVIEYVARTPGAIGYISARWLDERVRVLPVEGVYPSLTAVSDGSYPLSRPLYLAAMTEPSGEAREFAQWVLGMEGQAIIGRW
jgi:phosphate transport system substrate-binding protein